MKKICFVLGSHWRIAKGGSEYQSHVLIEHLRRNHPDEYEIYYLCLGKEFTRHQWDGVNVYTIPKRRFLSKFGRPFVFDYLRIHKVLNDIKPDIIYQRVGLAFTGIIAHYGRQNRCKTIWHIASEKTIDGSNVNFDMQFLNMIDRKILFWGIRHVDYVLGQAHYQNKMLKQNYNRECDLVIPNFHPVPQDDITKQENPKIIMWIGNFKNLKQPELFINLAAKFNRNHSAKFIMIGRPSSQQEWQTFLEKRINQTPNLEYLGEQSIGEVNNLLSKASVLVNTSKTEGFSNTFIQAWMREVPVVSLNVDPDSLLHKMNLGFCSRSFNQLVFDLELLLQNNTLRAQMGKKARVYSTRHFSLENVLKLESFISGVLGDAI